VQHRLACSRAPCAWQGAELTCFTWERVASASGADQPERRCARRRIFERGLALCGTDFLAHALWDKALNFELAAGAPLRAAALYTRVLGVPLRDLDRYWNRRAAAG